MAIYEAKLSTLVGCEDYSCGFKFLKQGSNFHVSEPPKTCCFVLINRPEKSHCSNENVDFASLGPSPCRDIHFSDPVHGYALKGHVIRFINVTNEDWCQIKCYLEGSCMSYNLGPKKDNVQECELSRSDHLQNPQDLIARANFIYRGTEVRMFLSLSSLSTS